MDLIVVDGSNLYYAAARMLSGLSVSPDLGRAYLSDWFDVDRWVRATLPPDASARLGIVVFHSRRALGTKAFRLQAQESDSYWARQGSSPNTSCITVEIPGEQHEAYPFDCIKCGERQNVTTATEKGIDTSITTYLLETAERWESTCIVARDVDYVPPVLALRRKGKSVFVASEPSDAPTALTRACQSFFALDGEFLKNDLAVYRLARSGGMFDELVKELNQPPTACFRIWSNQAMDAMVLGLGTDIMTRVELEKTMVEKVGSLGILMSKYEDRKPTHSSGMHTMVAYGLAAHALSIEGLFRRVGQAKWWNYFGKSNLLYEPMTPPPAVVGRDDAEQSNATTSGTPEPEGTDPVT